MVRDPLLDRLGGIDPAADLAVSDDERRRSRALAAAEIAARRHAGSGRITSPRAPRNRRWAALAAAGVVVAVAAGPRLGSLTGGTGPERAQAGPLAALASRAADVPAFPVPTADRPYSYVRRAITGPTVVHLPSGRLARARYRQDVETWRRADGSGRQRSARRPLAFDDPRDATAAGSRRARRTIVDDAPLGAGDDAARATNGIGRPLALGTDAIAALPDDPTALAAALDATATRTTAAAQGPAAARLGPARTTTDLAADLLSLDGVRPAVRAALVRVIGRAADVRARPGMRDPEGRSGTGLEWRSAEGHRTVLLIDPVTAQVLAQRTSIPDSVAGDPADDEPEPTIDAWTTILASGAVADIDERPAPGRP